MTGPLKNGQNQFSGAKLVLLAAGALAGAWLSRDLVLDRALSETHAALLAFLLAVGLINRVSARGRFRLKFGRDGAEVEADNNDRDH